MEFEYPLNEEDDCANDKEIGEFNDDFCFDIEEE